MKLVWLQAPTGAIDPTVPGSGGGDPAAQLQSLFETIADPDAVAGVIAMLSENAPEELQVLLDALGEQPSQEQLEALFAMFIEQTPEQFQTFIDTLAALAEGGEGTPGP